MPFVMEKSKSKKGLQYLKELPYSTEVQWDISDLLDEAPVSFGC